MISRIWYGWTTFTNANKKTLLKEEISVGIQDQQIRGLIEIHLLRRDLELEVEFITIMRFNSLVSVCESAGENYETVVVPTQARNTMKSSISEVGSYREKCRIIHLIFHRQRHLCAHRVIFS